MPEGPDGSAAPPAPPAAVDDAPQGDLGITVALEQFSGPMDLLLYLVRKAEVDVKDLPIATIADQFAAWVGSAAGTTLDLEAAGDFVVMAATLLEIKARLVAPPPEGTVVQDDGEDAFDPRAGLIRKLLVYRAAKEAAFDLDRRDDERRRRHERGHREVVPDDPAEIDAWELKDVGVGSLANLWFDLLKRLDAGGPRTVIVDDVPMGVRMAQVVEGMRARGEGRLSELFALELGPVARVGIVMAVLECTRQRMLRVRQAEQYGDVSIAFRPEDDRAVQQGDPGPPEMLPKRHRRPPLVTWSGAPQVEAEGDAAAEGDEEPAPVENEEQRFLRELEGDIGVERLLSRSADLERGFIDWWEETHPGEPLPPGVVKPEPPPPPPPPAPTVAEQPSEPAKPKRQPPRPRPAAEAPAAAASEAVAPVQPAGPAQVPVADPVTPAPSPAAEAPAPPIAAAPELQAPAPTVPDPMPAVASSAPDPMPAMPAAPQPSPAAQLPPDPAVAAADPAPVIAPVASQPPSPTAPAAADPISPAPAAAASPSFEVVPLPAVPPSPTADQPQAIDALPTGTAVEPDATEPVVEPEPIAATDPAAEPASAVAEPSELAPAAVAPAVEAPAPPAAVDEPPAAVEPAPSPVVATEPAPPLVVTAESPPPAIVAAPADLAPTDDPIASAPAVAVAPPPDPDPDPPPPPPPAPTTANTPPQPAPTSRPAPMPLPRHIKPAALTALWVACTVALVAWAYHPASMLEVDGPAPEAVVARDGAIIWRLNLPLDAERLGEAPLPSIEPAVPGAFAWRDARTCVFTPAGDLPADARLTVRFDPGLRAKGGFRFDDESVPVSTLRTLPELRATAAAATAIPAFADGAIEIGLSRVPADPQALLRAVAVEPAVPFAATLVDGRLRLDGPFAPRTAYRVSIAAGSGAADDRPAAFSAEVTTPARTPGARVAAGVGRQPRLEAVGVDLVVVEAADGRRDVVRLVPADDAVVAADLPAWLLAAGANRLRLRWDGGEAEAALHRHDIRLTPDDAVPALLGGTVPVTAAR